MTRPWIAFAALIALVGCRPAPEPEAPAEPRAPAEPSGASHPWAMFRGSAQHTGEFADRPAPAGTVRWRVELGERVDASAVIDEGGRVLVATRKGQVVALELASGRELGRAEVGGSLWASPALAGDTLVVASASGHLVGLDRRSLAIRWRQPAGARSFSGLTVWRGRIYLCAGRRLLEVDPEDGRIRRTADLGAASFTAPAISPDGATLVVGSRSGVVHAFELASFERSWQALARERTDGSPTIADGRVFIGSDDDALHAFDLATGRQLWEAGGERWVVSTPAVHGGLVYFGDDGGHLRAVSAATGELRWIRKVGGDLASGPTVVGDALIHGAHDGKVWMWNAASGEPAAEPIAVGASMYASPAVASDGVVVLSSHAGSVVAVE